MEGAAWKAQLGRARERDGRALQRSKEAEAAEARRRRRGGRKKAERKALSAEEVERARGRRVEAEKAGRDDEERKRKEEGQARAVLAAAAKAGANVGAVEAQKRGGGGSGKAAQEGGQPGSEASVRMEKAKAEADKNFDERKRVLEARAAKEKEFERYLSGIEDKVTTPRTGSRRRVLRIVHRAMLRQEENFVICEWGCGEWVTMGQPQHFHEVRVT